MKIICSRNNNVRETLLFLIKYLENKDLTHTLPDDDIMIEITLKGNKAIFPNDFLDPVLKERSEILKTKKYIHLHYNEHIDLKLIAGLANISPSHLSNLFKKETGRSFSTYLIDVRMHAAKKLLMSPDILIYEVAEKTGYSNGGYFGKAFKKYWGVSPEEFKKKKYQEILSCPPSVYL